ncbi:hypothetical protein LOTGIDRAFT_236692 [Lottia gigantea]|uniref:Selenoprotein S n=1 Tax=Lottia gigantea TaxID=225164 RepID=V3ZLV0_LOTGI|nr:hypothetical protein LOTGIDRAFT_236692 [Lottia gigantea]ESO83375.1 hypothetical protein LOTGIDRAFT_236692 [Lottia gigantea]
MAETGQAPPIQNQTPESVQSAISSVFGTLQEYGWFILIGLVALIYIKQKFLDPKIQQFTSQREERNEYKKYDSDAAQERVEAMERARKKLQDKFNQEAAVFAEEQKKSNKPYFFTISATKGCDKEEGSILNALNGNLGW